MKDDVFINQDTVKKMCLHQLYVFLFLINCPCISEDAGDRLYNVTGKVLSVLGLKFNEGSIYCKVRVIMYVLDITLAYITGLLSSSSMVQDNIAIGRQWHTLFASCIYFHFQPFFPSRLNDGNILFYICLYFCLKTLT